MRLLAWNLNHRAARRGIPSWISAATAEIGVDAAIFSEYVEGRDHNGFLTALSGNGLTHVSISERPRRQNQILIATSEPHVRRHIPDPGIHPAVPSNVLQVQLANSGITVLGFRMPAYPRREAHLKRPTWNWLLEIAALMGHAPTVLAGDFNTALGDSSDYCGDCLMEFQRLGWTHARPETGYSWRHSSGSERQIDHAFLSPALESLSASYSWAFQKLSPDATSGTVGLPDHAMLIVDFQARGPSAPAV
jgi:endonuclease/exonuclease/phosphatase family metal-dependent hydrolase